MKSRNMFLLTVLMVLAAMAVLWRPLRWLFGLLPALALVLLLITATALIVLILIQRGKGGGLSGAFGGMGGQSAFGAKAGDTFTKITVGLAVFWIYLCVVSVGTKTTAAQDPLGLGSGRPAAEQGAERTGSSGQRRPGGELPGDAPEPAPQQPAPGDAAE